ncbi:MAG TPA: LapA family protein [Mycobacteriales bacterium]|nr:LapA family protein [Mycobacteriales bacterium]
MADESTGPTAKDEKPGLSPRLVGAIIAIILALIFVFQNTREVPIRFIVPKATVHVWAALLVSLALGILIGYFGARHSRKK